MANSPSGGGVGGSSVPSWVLPVAGLTVIGLGGLLLGGIDGGTETTAAATPSSEASQVPSTAPATTSAQPARTATTEPSTSAPLTTTVPPPTTAAPTSSGVDFLMPDLVGSDLQSAQDAVQELGVFYSVSHDLLGSRNQVLDSNWIVCDQNVTPGQRVTGEAEGKLDFGVVKREEQCP